MGCEDSLNVFVPPAAEWQDVQFLDIGGRSYFRICTHRLSDLKYSFVVRFVDISWSVEHNWEPLQCTLFVLARITSLWHRKDWNQSGFPSESLLVQTSSRVSALSSCSKCDTPVMMWFLKPTLAFCHCTDEASRSNLFAIVELASNLLPSNRWQSTQAMTSL